MRKKTIALITALVFMLSVMMPLSAFAANDDWTKFSSFPEYVSTGTDKPAGTITVKCDDLGELTDSKGASVSGKVYEAVIRVDLPAEVEFSDTPDLSWVKYIGIDVNDIKENAFGSRYAEVTTKTEKWDANAGVIFDFSAAEVDIDSDFVGDVKARVTVTGVDSYGKIMYTDWDDLVIAKVAGADVSVTAADPKTRSMGGDKKLAKITIKEAQAKALKDTKIRFDIMSKGVTFDDGFNVKSGADSVWTANRVDFEFLEWADTTKTSSDVKEILNSDRDRFMVEAVGESTSLPGMIEFTPVVKIDPNATGDIKVRVSSPNNSDLKSTTLVVGSVGDVTGEIAKVKDNDTVVYAGSPGTELDVNFEIKTVDGSNFEDGKIVSLALNNGKFVKDEMAKDGSRWTLYDNDRSAYLTIEQPSDKDKIKVNSGDIWVKCNNDVEEGDIILTAGGNAGVEGEVVVGEFAKPFTVTAETPNILSEALNQKAGDITITEVDGEALEKGYAVFFELPSGVELKGTPKVEVDEGNIDVEDPVVIDKNIIALEVKSDSSDASTIRIYDIKYDTGRLALYGPVELDVYMAEPVLKDGKFDKWKAIDGIMTTVANAKVDDQNTVTATFTLGDEGVTIANGRTLVQVNLLCDVLGLQKSWDAAAKTAYFAKDGKVVAFPMGENAIYINGVKLPVDQGGMIINDFTYATLRGVQLAFGGELDWDNDTKTATFVFNK